MNMTSPFIKPKTLLFLGSSLLGVLVALTGCVSNPASTADLQKLKGRVPAEKLLAVDCLLPPQIRKAWPGNTPSTACNGSSTPG